MSNGAIFVYNVGIRENLNHRFLILIFHCVHALEKMQVLYFLPFLEVFIVFKHL